MNNKVFVKCKILKCKNQLNDRFSAEAIHLQCSLNGHKVIYMCCIYDGGCDGFVLYKGGSFDENYEPSYHKWQNISETIEGFNFLNAFINHANKKNIDFTRDEENRSNLIEGMEFEVEKF